MHLSIVPVHTSCFFTCISSCTALLFHALHLSSYLVVANAKLQQDEFVPVQNPRKLQKLLCSVTATVAYAGSSCWLTVTALIPLGALICDTFLILHLHWTNCHCRFAVMRHSTAKNCKELQMTAKKLQRMAGQCIFITQPSEHTSYNC